MPKDNRERFDVHQHITDQIIAAIEAGAGNWQMPWHRSAHAITRPQNIASGKAYRGINVLSLWVAGAANDYAHGLWGTYRQWQEQGAQVKKGEKSSVIVFYKELERAREDDPIRNRNRAVCARQSRLQRRAGRRRAASCGEDERPSRTGSSRWTPPKPSPPQPAPW